MPELPEVETIRRGLLPKLIGQEVDKIEIRWQKSFAADDLKNLIHHKITDIERRGKVMIIRLANHYSLLIHLKMTGQLILIRKTGKRYGGGHPTSSLVNEGCLCGSSTETIEGQPVSCPFLTDRIPQVIGHVRRGRVPAVRARAWLQGVHQSPS